MGKGLSVLFGVSLIALALAVLLAIPSDTPTVALHGCWSRFWQF
jgi:hypothetical protein